MRHIDIIKPKTLLPVKHKNQYTENEKKQSSIMANYFKKQQKKDKPSHPDLLTIPIKKFFKRKFFYSY